MDSGTAFFDELAGVWEVAAERAGGSAERTYRIAGAHAELRFAGDALLPPLTRALAHLPPGHGGLDSLVVYAWESETTGTAMPAPPWGADDYRERGTIRGHFDERFHTVFQWGSRSLVMLDVDRNRALYWVRSARQIPHWEMAAPLRLVLHGWLATRGIDLIHAAAVGGDDGCVLMVGRSGSGKSWATLACAAAGLRLLADDYCLIRPGAPPRVASLYSSAKAHATAFDRLPALRPMVSNPLRPDDDKAVFFLHEHVPDWLLLEAELRAVLVPRVIDASAAATVRAAPSGAALGALAPATILQLPAAGAATMQRLADLVQAVPCYHLDLGPDLATVPAAIRRVLPGR